MIPNRLTGVALRWTPQGKRKKGRPKPHVEEQSIKEVKAIDLIWGKTEIVALDRIRWRQRVKA